MPRDLNQIIDPPNVSGEVGRQTDTYFNRLYRAVMELDTRTKIQHKDIATATAALNTVNLQQLVRVSANLQSNGLAPLNVTGLIGKLAQPQTPSIPNVLVLPVPPDPLAQDGTIVRFNNQVYYYNAPTEPGTWLPLSALAVVLRDTRANFLSTYPAASYPSGSLFYITNWDVYYQNNGTAWLYAWGTFRSTLAGILTGLGANDTHLRNAITDYSHVLRWTGSAWTWADEDDHMAGSVILRKSAPAGYGANAWQVFDGSTVAVMNADGTTSNVTVDDLSTAAYLKGSTAESAVAAASGTVANTTAVNQDADLAPTTDLFTLDAGGDPAVTGFTNPHGHTQDAHNHAAGTLELRNKQFAVYLRR